MYVKRVFYDECRNAEMIEKVIENPMWEDVERIIEMLDGEKVTQITMDNGNEDNYLCIGGGNNGLCNVYISKRDNEFIYTLINPQADASKIHKLITGGQEGDFEDTICVKISLAKQVAKKFFELGEIDNLCMWGEL